MASNARAEAFAPASMGNVGIGFDILGLAYADPGDIVIAEPSDTPGASIKDIQGDDGRLPFEADKNVVSIVANHMLKRLDIHDGVSLTLMKGLPLASGLGSSAASSVAAAVAVNALFGEPFAKEELLPSCLEGEAAVSGYHADNVGPALLGGITLITGTSMDEIRQLPVPDNMWFALVKADVEVPTAKARAVLPQQVSLKTTIAQTGYVARFIDALYRNDLEQAAAMMEMDQLAEPARASLIPLLADVRTSAKRTGALSLAISGAGPALCAVCDDKSVAESVVMAMQNVYQNTGISSTGHVTTVSKEGASVLGVS